ncbi:hypothetical protein R6Q59_024249 [Mikania micrantha]
MVSSVFMDLTFATKVGQHLKANSCFKRERGKELMVQHYVGDGSAASRFVAKDGLQDVSSEEASPPTLGRGKVCVHLFPHTLLKSGFSLAEEDDATISSSMLADIELQQSSTLDDEKMLLLSKPCTDCYLSPTYKYLTLWSLGELAVLLNCYARSFRGISIIDESDCRHILCDPSCIVGGKARSTHMAGFQICFQVWLAASFLADGLVVAGQL